MGHYKTECPQLKGTKGFLGVTHEKHWCNSNNEGYLNDMRKWILLDNQSTTDIFCNKKLLKNIRTTKESTEIVTNGGGLKTNMKGTLPNYGEVWYHPKAITNILSMRNVAERYPISYCSE